MIFEETKTITLTQEQAETHIAALVTHIKRMTRKLAHNDMRIAECQADGDLAMALKISNSKQQRIQRIADTKKELERMRQIFGDRYNG